MNTGMIFSFSVQLLPKHFYHNQFQRPITCIYFLSSPPVLYMSSTSLPVLYMSPTSLPVLYMSSTSLPVLKMSPTSLPVLYMSPTSLPVLYMSSTSLPAEAVDSHLCVFKYLFSDAMLIMCYQGSGYLPSRGIMSMEV